MAASLAEAANEQVRDFHKDFADKVMKAVPALRRPDLPPEELTKITTDTVRDLIGALPEDSEERRNLQAELDKIGAPDQKGCTFEQKLGAGAIVGTGAISLICFAVQEAMHGAKMGGIAKAREAACKMIEAGNSNGAKHLLIKDGSMVCPERKLTMADADHIRKNHATSSSTDQEHLKAGWADYVAVVGSSVQLLSALAMLGYTIHTRRQVIKECTDDKVDAEGKATWLRRLNESKKTLKELMTEYDKFITEEVSTLGDGGSLDADGITPVWMQYQEYVTRAQAIVIDTMNLALEVQQKSTELANQLWSAGTMAAGAAVQAGVALAQALARPNPATWVNFALLTTTTVVGSGSVVLTRSAQGYLRDFDREVNHTLIAAKAFLARMTRGRNLAKEGMVAYKSLQSTLKSSLQLELEEEQRKSELAQQAAEAKDKEIEELRRLLAASKAEAVKRRDG